MNATYSNRKYKKKDRHLRGTIPAGRIFMVRKRGWAGLRGFGRKFPGQRSELKSEHPGLVVKDSKSTASVIEMVPGTTAESFLTKSVFSPVDDPVFVKKGGSTKRGKFLLEYWRTVRKESRFIRSHHSDLTKGDRDLLLRSMAAVHGETWEAGYPDAGPG